jgi:hypothetical protein
MAKKWVIVSYRVGQQPGRDYIESSIGVSYCELKTIASRMNRNGEGQRYMVREYVVPTKTVLCFPGDPDLELKY